MELLSVTMNGGVKPRSEIEGKDNSSDDKSNYKIVLTGDMVYNFMRMWQGANGISPCDGIDLPLCPISCNNHYTNHSSYKTDTLFFATEFNRSGILTCHISSHDRLKESILLFLG